MIGHINLCLLTGEVQAIDLKYSTRGTAVLTMRVLVTESWEKDGETQEKQSKIDCVAFGKQAEQIKKMFAIGQGVMVQGKLSANEFEGREGKVHNRQQVTIQSVTLHAAEKIEKAGPADEEPPSDDLPF